jgi:hypothetical protein
MGAPVKKSRRLFFASTTLFVAFSSLTGGGLFRLLPPTAAEIAGQASTLAGIQAWTPVCVACGLDRKSPEKPTP